MTTILPWKQSTTTIILDDSSSFLESMELMLSPKKRKLLFTTSSDDALKLINDSNEMVKKNLKISVKNQKFDHTYLEEISVAVIDYQMPSINGLDFCKKIKNTMCKKILLTANSDDKIAIKAFNEGLIQQYIRKQDPNIDELLESAIEEAEEKYFEDKVDSIIPPMEQNELFFKNTNFQNFFYSFIKKEKIVEYCLLDSKESIICKDENNRKSFIFVKNKEEIQVPLTWQETEAISPRTLQEIRECKKMFCIPFNLTDKEFSLDKYIITAIKIQKEPELFVGILHQ